MTTLHHSIRAKAQRQRGQALVETIIACCLFMLLLFALQWVWRFGELKQLSTEAVRFAMWERSAYKADGAADMKSVYGGDADLAPTVFRHVYLTPRGARLSQDVGGGALMEDHPDWMTAAARFFAPTLEGATFGAVTGAALTVKTDAAKVPGGPMGFDPTHGGLTSLKLDTQPYERVQVNGAIGLGDFVTQFMEQRFGIASGEASSGAAPSGAASSGAAPSSAAAISNSELGSLTMVTNSWSAPGTVAIKRMFEELNPLAPTNHVGMVINNNKTANLSQLIGGSAGFGGNYRVDKWGINPAQISSLVTQGMGSNFDNLKNPGELAKMFKPTNEYKENFNFMATSIEPDFVAINCDPQVPNAIRFTQYTQDELCPGGTMRARVISVFDNPAWRFSGP